MQAPLTSKVTRVFPVRKKNPEPLSRLLPYFFRQTTQQSTDATSRQQDRAEQKGALKGDNWSSIWHRRVSTLSGILLLGKEDSCLGADIFALLVRLLGLVFLCWSSPICRWKRPSVTSRGLSECVPTRLRVLAGRPDTVVHLTAAKRRHVRLQFPLERAECQQLFIHSEHFHQSTRR